MNALRGQLEQAARDLGFDRVIVGKAQPLTVWRDRAGVAPHWAKLTWDPQALLPGAQRALLLLRAYRPYAPRPGLATVSAFYPCSQASYQAAAGLAPVLEARGYRALARPDLPYKAMLVASGGAAYGVNGITAAPGLGSRYAIQVVLTDAPLDVDAPEAREACDGCRECVAACPVGAIGRGELVVNRCLRALDANRVVPVALRALLGNSLLGCDLCQDVCARNRGVGVVRMPSALSDALELRALLMGNVKPLIPFMGVNYARKSRIQARALLVAANEGRVDLLDAIGALVNDPWEPTRVHARWAMETLRI